jgi:hypothetical protein
MIEWEGPVTRTFLDVYLAIAATFILMVISFFVDGLFEIVISIIILLMFLFIPALFVLTWRLPKVRDFYMSRWLLDRDLVCWRIDMAIQKKGIRAIIGHDGSKVIFPLPPYSIIVAPGRRQTLVYVGPATEQNRARFEALKTFVESTLVDGRKGAGSSVEVKLHHA